MIKIGLLSDTHGYADPLLKEFFSECDEIWHAGDIGSTGEMDEFRSFKPFRAVYGNIDDIMIRKMYPEFQCFRCEQMEIIMTHIGGSPGRYHSGLRKIISAKKPDLLITGHSHILKIVKDKDFGFLYINPGAAGNTGSHNIRTAVRFIIESNRIKDLEVIELGKR